MTERKLLSALITSLAAFFILPLLYNDFQGGFITAALHYSMYTCPTIFTYGLVISYISDLLAVTKRNRLGFSFFFHSIGGAASALLVFLYTSMSVTLDGSMQPELLTAGFTLGVIFFMVDMVLKNWGEYLNLKNDF